MAVMKQWTVKVNDNPRYCGEGAGGAQFAHGQAIITSERLANWFAAHKGYTVEPVKAAAAEPKK